MSVTILPTFKGYTVDLRLKEVRRAIPDATLEFIPFNTAEGKKLWDELESFAQETVDFYSYELQTIRAGEIPAFFCASFHAQMNLTGVPTLNLVTTNQMLFAAS